MFDAMIRPYTVPSLDKIAARVEEFKIAAPLITLGAFGIGLVGCFFVAIQSYLFGLLLIVGNRILHGLSAAMARRQGMNSFVAYIDAVCAYTLYAAFVFLFIVAIPGFHLAGAFLMLSLTTLAVSHLANLWIRAAEAGDAMEATTEKTVIVESTELSLFMIAACLFPGWFPGLAFLFGLLCLATAVQRALRTWYNTMRAVEDSEPQPEIPAGRIKTKLEQDLENSGL